MTEKQCRKCSTIKPLDSFHKNRGAKDGHAVICKSCACAKSREWVSVNKERARARGRSNYVANRDRYLERAKEWKRNNQQRRREIVSNYGKRHRPTRRVKARRQRQNNLDHYREAGRRAAAIRKSRELGNGGNLISLDWWKAVLNVVETKTCMYCGTGPHDLTMDHFIPVALGGKTEIGNLIPCCKSCNSRKGKHSPEQWVKQQCGEDGYRTIKMFLDATRNAYFEYQEAA